MVTYLKKVLNNCSESSRIALEASERELSLRESAELKVHLTFCKCCTNFLKQSKVIDKSLKMWKLSLETQPSHHASDVLKKRLEALINNYL